MLIVTKFKGADFYNTDDLLTDDEKMVRDSIREWVDEKVIPIIEKHYMEGTFPMHLIPEKAELGIFGATLPEKYGCAYLNIRSASSPTVSPDGKFIAYLTDVTGTNQVWKVRISSGCPEQLTFF